MPANIVKTEEDERHWEEAKAQVRKEYPKIAEGSERFYKLVMEIFRRMKHRTGGRPAPPPEGKKKSFARYVGDLRKAKGFSWMKTVWSQPPEDASLPDGAHRTPPEGYPKDRSQYAIPGCYMYPLDTPKRIQAAMSYFSQHGGAFPPHIRKAAWRRIIRAAKEAGKEVSEEVQERAKAMLPGDLAKGRRRGHYRTDPRTGRRTWVRETTTRVGARARGTGRKLPGYAQRYILVFEGKELTPLTKEDLKGDERQMIASPPGKLRTGDLRDALRVAERVSQRMGKRVRVYDTNRGQYVGKAGFLDYLRKARVKPHTRRLRSGKVVQVSGHERRGRPGAPEEAGGRAWARDMHKQKVREWLDRTFDNPAPETSDDLAAEYARGAGLPASAVDWLSDYIYEYLRGQQGTGRPAKPWQGKGDRWYLYRDTALSGWGHAKAGSYVISNVPVKRKEFRLIAEADRPEMFGFGIQKNRRFDLWVHDPDDPKASPQRYIVRPPRQRGGEMEVIGRPPSQQTRRKSFAGFLKKARVKGYYRTGPGGKRVRVRGYERRGRPVPGKGEGLAKLTGRIVRTPQDLEEAMFRHLLSQGFSREQLSQVYVVPALAAARAVAEGRDDDLISVTPTVGRRAIEMVQRYDLGDFVDYFTSSQV